MLVFEFEGKGNVSKGVSLTVLVMVLALIMHINRVSLVCRLAGSTGLVVRGLVF